MSNEVVTQQSKPIMEITAEDVKNYFCPTATVKETGMFLQVAKRMNLDPFKREIYLVKYGDNPASVVAAFEPYLRRAESSGVYNGFKVWTEGKVEDKTLKGCIEVRRKDWPEPLYHEVFYVEYVQKTKQGDITKFWREKPITMIKKVAMAQGHRLAFSKETDGLPYVEEELNTEKQVNEIPKSGKSLLTKKPEPEKPTVTVETTAEEVKAPTPPEDAGKDIDSKLAKLDQAKLVKVLKEKFKKDFPDALTKTQKEAIEKNWEKFAGWVEAVNV